MSLADVLRQLAAGESVPVDAFNLAGLELLARKGLVEQFPPDGGPVRLSRKGWIRVPRIDGYFPDDMLGQVLTLEPDDRHGGTTINVGGVAGDWVAGDKVCDNARKIVIESGGNATFVESQTNNSYATRAPKSNGGKGGRPLADDARELSEDDVECACRAWYSDRYRTRAECAAALGADWTADDVRRAIDRDRKREQSE